MDTYSIKIVGEYGQPEKGETTGTIVGPFGVAEFMANGVYRVTHLHSGLKIRYMCASNRDVALRAARHIGSEIPFWRSHNPERIANVNGFESLAALGEEVRRIAEINGCDGEEEDKDEIPGDNAD